MPLSTATKKKPSTPCSDGTLYTSVGYDILSNYYSRRRRHVFFVRARSSQTWLDSHCWPVGGLCVERAELGQFRHPLGSSPPPIFRRFRKKRRRAMGGFGSGQTGGDGREKVEACRSIDVNQLCKTGCLRDGSAGCWQWTRDGEKLGSINLHAEADQLHLSYRVRIAGGEWEDVAETVRVLRAPCRYGGVRPYLLCPGIVNGVTCGRRVAKLHAAGRYFLCRHCYRLAYASQSEREGDRTRRRASKIRRRLGGDPDMVAPFPPKPKGMWRRTYDRLRKQASAAEMLAEEAFTLRAERLVTRIENSKREGSFWR